MRKIILGTGLGALALTAGVAFRAFRGRTYVSSVGPSVHVVTQNPNRSRLVDSTGNVIGEITRQPRESEKDYLSRVERERRIMEQRSESRPASRPAYDARLIPRPPGKIPAYPPIKALEYIQREHPELVFDLQRPQKKIIPRSLVEVEWQWHTNDPSGNPVIIPQRTFVYASEVNGNEVTIEQEGPMTNTSEYAADKTAGQKATQTSLSKFLTSIGGKVTNVYPSTP